MFRTLNAQSHTSHSTVAQLTTAPSPSCTLIFLAASARSVVFAANALLLAPRTPLQTGLSNYATFLPVSALLMPESGGRIGGQNMPRVQLPAVTPKHRAWNKGRIVGQKRPLMPKKVWTIRARLELAHNLRDLALFCVAIDSKLRGCDLVKLAVSSLVKHDRVRERVSVIQSKTKRLVQFEPT